MFAMAIIPAGIKVGDSSFGKVYQDRKGNSFFMIPRSFKEIIEARVTNGRGYVTNKDKDYLNIPYSENPHKDKINPEIFCFRRMDISKYFGWNEDVKNGHPAYRKLIHNVISLD